MSPDRLSPMDASFLHIEDDVVAHAYRLGGGLRGTRTSVRRGHGHDRGQARARPALPAGGAVRALRPGTTGLGGRPPLQPRLPRPPHRAAVPGRRSRVAAAWSAGSWSSRSIAPSRCGRSGWSRGSRAAAGPCCPRPTMRMVDGVSGTDMLSVLMDQSAEAERPTAPAAGPRPDAFRTRTRRRSARRPPPLALRARTRGESRNRVPRDAWHATRRR